VHCFKITDLLSILPISNCFKQLLPGTLLHPFHTIYTASLLSIWLLKRCHSIHFCCSWASPLPATPAFFNIPFVVTLVLITEFSFLDYRLLFTYSSMLVCTAFALPNCNIFNRQVMVLSSTLSYLKSVPVSSILTNLQLILHQSDAAGYIFILWAACSKWIHSRTRCSQLFTHPESCSSLSQPASHTSFTSVCISINHDRLQPHLNLRYFGIIDIHFSAVCVRQIKRRDNLQRCLLLYHLQWSFHLVVISSCPCQNDAQIVSYVIREVGVYYICSLYLSPCSLVTPTLSKRG
jgi:hypothetical protein